MTPALVRCLRVVLVATALVLSLLQPSLRAGGFSLSELNGVGTGECFSNTAAAEDASTTVLNPAGLAWLKQPQVVGAAHVVFTSAKFTDAGSTTAGTIPLRGNDGGNPGGAKLLPNLYYGQPLTRSLAFGVGVTVPWGLSTDYADGWIGRYQALKSELKTINVTVAGSWRISDQLAIGLGLQEQRASVELSNAIDFGLLGYSRGIPGFAPGAADGKVVLKANDTKAGAVAGILYEPVAGTRFGFTYRSKLTYHFVGDATFTGVPTPFAAVFPNQAARASLTTPATLSLHAMQDWGAWRLTAEATWWRFNSFKVLAVDFENPLTPDSSKAEDWKNAGLYSVGAAYRWNEHFTLRFGAAYNTTPIPSAERRTPRIPDANRTWLSIGATWRPAPNCDVHVGYAHLFFANAPVDDLDSATHHLVGSFDVSADVLSAQATLRF